MKELRYLNKYFVKYKWRLVGGLIFVIAATALQIVPAQMVRRSIDLLVNTIDAYRTLDDARAQADLYPVFIRQVLFYAALILGMALLRGVFLYLTRQTLIVTSRLIEYDFKNELFTHYQVLPLSFYKKNSTGDMMNRISEDVSRVRMYLGPCIMYGLQLAVLFLMLIPIMISISSKMTWYALAPLPLLSFSIYFVHSIIERESEKIQQSQSRLSTLVQEAFSGIRVLKSFVREKESAHHFAAESRQYMNRSLKLTWIQALFFPLMTALIGLSAVLVVYAGSVEVFRGALSLGNIAEFIMYVNLLTWPVISLGWISSIVQRAEASQKRINEFLRTPAYGALKGGEELAMRGKVAFKNVSFTYADTRITALKNVSFTVAPGETLAIVGATGSGKSSVLHLLGRLYEPTAGEVYIDDRPIGRYKLDFLRRQMGFVTQDVFLFSDTIYNNIAFGTPYAVREEVIKAAREAAVYSAIKAFSDGFNTHVGERGVTLSGGQKQRISIARALVRRPQILVLDDALSAVDTETENTLLHNIHAAMKGKTTLIVSHRASSAKLADRIIVLDDGRIVEEGMHADLMAAEGVYYNLYEEQRLLTRDVRQEADQ